MFHHEFNDRHGIRPLRHEVSHQHDLIARTNTSLTDQLPQLRHAAMHIANDERSAARRGIERRVQCETWRRWEIQ